MALTIVLNSCGHETSNWPLLYKSDLEFSHTYQMILEGLQVPDFHLQDALLCHFGHIFIPSSGRAKMIWEAHYSWSIGHFGVEKTVAVFRSISIGLVFDRMLRSTSNPALPTSLPNWPSRSKASILRCLPLVYLGNPYPWITCWVFLLLSMPTTVLLCSLIDSRRWPLWWPTRRIS